VYVNLAMITHSPTEIVIDFSRVMPRTPKSRVLAPHHHDADACQTAVQSLEDNLKKFESQFGEIKIWGMPNQSKTIGFAADDDKSGDAR